MLSPAFAPNVLAGGAAIGTAAVVLAAFNGRILGVSGIVGRAFTDARSRGSPSSEQAQRVALLGGLLTASALLAPAVKARLPLLHPVAVFAAGLLVTFGSRTGSGCTSGHGICGLGRLSKRSLVAVATFMASGFATAWFVHASQFASYFAQAGSSVLVVSLFPGATVVGSLGVVGLAYALYHANRSRSVPQVAVAGSCGALMAWGLVKSGMTEPDNVLGFLSASLAWNSSLMGVMAAGMGVSLLGFQLLNSRRKPLLESRFDFPSTSKIDTPLVVGSLLFGVGWGIAGVCPGPGLVALASGTAGSVIWLLGALTGLLVFESVKI